VTATDTGHQAGDFARTPPHDLAAEQGALGSMLLSPAAVAEVTEIIRPADNYRPAHQIIHEAILALVAEGEPVDAITVGNLLIKRGDLGRVGGGAYLHTLIASVPTWAFGASYARIVRNLAVKREAIEIGTRIVQLGYDGDADAADLAERARTMADGIGTTSAAADLLTMSELFAEVIDDLENDAPRGVPTPWADVNHAIGGLMPGQPVIIAGRTGSAKSMAALGIAAHAAIRERVPTLMATMEMTRREVMTRLIAAEGRVPLHAMMHRQVEPGDWARITAVRERIADAPLAFDDSPVCSVANLRSRLRAMRRKTPAGLLVVDYIGLLDGPKAESRQVEVSAMSRGLKLLAGEFAIPVVVVAQLNRNPESRHDKRPQASDLRDSGSLEQDASVVILLHRPDLNEIESPRAGEIDFIIDKNRNGPRCTVTEAFQGHYARIMDMAPLEWSPSAQASDAA
jgi:replicative DNA helicase